MSEGNSIEARVARMETHVAMLDRLLQERVAALDRATELQACEYARRLDELNHAHAQALQDRGHFLAREVWEAYISQLESWRASVTTELALTRGKALGWTLAMGSGVVILTLLLRWLK
jgi:hypothetical protein